MATLGALSQLLSALAFAGFGGVALWLLSRPRARMAALMPSPRWLIAAAIASAIWCAALYRFAPGSSEAMVARPLRDLAMLGWLGATFWPAQAPMPGPRLILRLLVTICAIALVGGIAAHMQSAAAGAWLSPALDVSAMIVAIGGLLIVDGAARGASVGLRMPVMAVAGGFAMLWAYELNVQLIGALTGKPASTLIHLIPAVALLMAPTFVLAAMDVGRERIRLSRSVATRTLVLLGAASYLILIGLTGLFPHLFSTTV